MTFKRPNKLSSFSNITVISKLSRGLSVFFVVVVVDLFICLFIFAMCFSRYVCICADWRQGLHSELYISSKFLILCQDLAKLLSCLGGARTFLPRPLRVLECRHGRPEALLWKQMNVCDFYEDIITYYEIHLSVHSE